MRQICIISKAGYTSLNWYDCSSVNKKLTDVYVLTPIILLMKAVLKQNRQYSKWICYWSRAVKESKAWKDLEKGKRLQGNFETEAEIWEKCCIKGMNLVVVATGKDRNNTIGGHKAWVLLFI